MPRRPAAAPVVTSLVAWRSSARATADAGRRPRLGPSVVEARTDRFASCTGRRARIREGRRRTHCPGGDGASGHDPWTGPATRTGRVGSGHDLGVRRARHGRPVGRRDVHPDRSAGPGIATRWASSWSTILRAGSAESHRVIAATPVRRWPGATCCSPATGRRGQPRASRCTAATTTASTWSRTVRPKGSCPRTPKDGHGRHPVAFFSFPTANPDGFHHFRLPSGDTVAIEDFWRGGDRDFNDAVLNVQFLVRPVYPARNSRHESTDGPGRHPAAGRDDPGAVGRFADEPCDHGRRAGRRRFPGRGDAEGPDRPGPGGTGALVDVAFDPASGSFHFPTGLAQDGSADGVHTVQFQATDAANNTSGLTSVSFTLDTRPPTVQSRPPPRARWRVATRPSRAR